MLAKVDSAGRVTLLTFLFLLLWEFRDPLSLRLSYNYFIHHNWPVVALTGRVHYNTSLLQSIYFSRGFSWPVHFINWGVPRPNSKTPRQELTVYIFSEIVVHVNYKPYAILQFSHFFVACNNAKALLFNYQFAISFLQCLNKIHKYLDKLYEGKVEKKIIMICIVMVSHLLNRRWYITVVTVTDKWWRYSFVPTDFL